MYKSNLINLMISYIGLTVGLFNTVFKPKVMTAEEIGIFSTLISITLLLKLLSLGGLTSVIMKFYPEYKNSENKRKFVSSTVITSYIILIFVIMVLFSAKNILVGYFNNSSINEYFIYIPLYLFLSHGIDLMERFSRVLFVSVRSNMIRNVYFKFINCSFLIFMFFTEFGLTEYFYFFITLNIFTFLLMFRLVHTDLQIKWNLNDMIPDLSFLKKFVSYSFFMMISAFSAIIVISIDKIMIGHYLDLSKTGVYTIAVAIASTMNIIFTSFALIAQPEIAGLMQRGLYKDLKKSYLDNIYNNLHFGIIVFVLLSVFANDILDIFGKQYSEGYRVIIIIAAGQLINLSVGLCGEMIALSKYYKFDFYSRIGLIIIVVISNSLLIPTWGITGAAVATTLNVLMYDAIKLFYAYKKFNLHPFRSIVLQFYISGAFIAGSTLLTKKLISPDLFGIVVISVFYFLLYDVILGYVAGYKNSVVKRTLNKINKTT